MIVIYNLPPNPKLGDFQMALLSPEMKAYLKKRCKTLPNLSNSNSTSFILKTTLQRGQAEEQVRKYLMAKDPAKYSSGVSFQTKLLKLDPINDEENFPIFADDPRTVLFFRITPTPKCEIKTKKFAIFWYDKDISNDKQLPSEIVIFPSTLTKPRLTETQNYKKELQDQKGQQFSLDVSPLSTIPLTGDSSDTQNREYILTQKQTEAINEAILQAVKKGIIECYTDKDFHSHLLEEFKGVVRESVETVIKSGLSHTQNPEEMEVEAANTVEIREISKRLTSIENYLEKEKSREGFLKSIKDLSSSLQDQHKLIQNDLEELIKAKRKLQNLEFLTELPAIIKTRPLPGYIKASQFTQYVNSIKEEGLLNWSKEDSRGKTVWRTLKVESISAFWILHTSLVYYCHPSQVSDLAALKLTENTNNSAKNIVQTIKDTMDNLSIWEAIVTMLKQKRKNPDSSLETIASQEKLTEYIRTKIEDSLLMEDSLEIDINSERYKRSGCSSRIDFYRVLMAGVLTKAELEQKIKLNNTL